jgi:adenosylcobinamide kinase/adenosylcobinamide-phosphate guanylyltransferase
LWIPKNDVLSVWNKQAEIDAPQNKQNTTIIIVTNEIEIWTLHAAVGRKFTELQGWMNQYIAKTADTVVLMVSGITS